MTKKKVIIIAAVVLILAVLVWGVFTQILFPISLKKCTTEIWGIENVDTWKNFYEGTKNSPATGDQIFIEDNAFASNNAEDYADVCVRMTFKNNSMFDITYNDCILNNVSEDSGIIFKSSDLIPTQIPKSEEAFGATNFYIQRRGRSDEEILEAVKKIDATVYYDTFLKNGNKMNVSFKDAKIEILE